MSIFAALLSAGSLLLPTVCTCPRLMSGSMTVTPSFGLLGSTLMIPKPCTMILTVLKDGRDGTVKALGPMDDWAADATLKIRGRRLYPIAVGTNPATGNATKPFKIRRLLILSIAMISPFSKFQDFLRHSIPAESHPVIRM